MKSAEENESIVWAWAPDFAANWTRVPPTREIHDSVEVLLSQHSALTITVVDVDGKPVAASAVCVVGLNPLRSGELARRAFRNFQVSVQTDDAGMASVSVPDGSIVAWAEKGSLRSVPSLDIPANVERLKLSLQPSFTVIGDVSPIDEELYQPTMQVTAYAKAGSTTLRLAQGRVLENGDVATFCVPLTNSDGYEFVVRGGGALPSIQRIVPPQPDSTVTLHFALKGGSSIQVLVTDEKEVPIEGANVLVQWEQEGGGAQVATTDDHGDATVLGLYPTGLTLNVRAKGFIPVSYSNINPSDYEGDSISILLEPGGTLRGRVLKATKPLQDFSVVFWRPDTPAARIETAFHDKADGRFEIEGAPLGDLLVYASSSEYPRSDVHSAFLKLGSSDELVFELPDPLVGSGQVLDANTAQPIPTAKIELWNSYRAAYLSPAGGGQHAVEPDGRFKIKGFPPGDSRFVVRASGYSQYLGLASARAGEAVDLGIIAMQRSQRLQVRLTSTTPIDFTGYSSNADGNAPYPMQFFNADGVASWDDAGPNLYYVRVFLPDDSVMSLERYCRPGSDWEFVFPQDPSRTLDVLVSDLEGDPLQPDGDVVVHLVYTAIGGNQLVHSSGLAETGKAHFGTVAAKRVYAEVIGDSGDRLAADTFTLEDGANEVRLTLGGKSLRVHVTSPDGAPLEGATLDARMAAGESPWFQLTSTDAGGLHTFTGLGMKRLFINVQHDQFGARSDVEVDLETWKSEETLEIKLDPRATVAVRLLDGKAPVPAASVRILGPHSGHILGVFTTDAGGNVRYGPVAPGSYLVAVEQPGVWLTEQLVEAGDKDHPRDVQVRKLGGLSLQLVSASGQAAAGVGVELESSETGAKLSDWIERGLVSVGGGEFVSDAGGHALVTGIPHGEYVVRLTSQAGSYVAGRVTVQAGAPTNSSLTLP
ncbi:MAG TPA: carboxypeptidase regulatory-like domain-containing protein [Planctomycetota bacterium]|nr:carboxypeptidase regulatory-like domain-containing protein [Planctomycetota bacterium]